jgi:hypothetical protein
MTGQRQRQSAHEGLTSTTTQRVAGGLAFPQKGEAVRAGVRARADIQHRDSPARFPRLACRSKRVVHMASRMIVGIIVITPVAPGRWGPAPSTPPTGRPTPTPWGPAPAASLMGSGVVASWLLRYRWCHLHINIELACRRPPSPPATPPAPAPASVDLAGVGSRASLRLQG